jgi:nicotinate-nucleotide adenylyltransferase
MPVATPPHKEADADPGAATRLALCRAAVGGDPRFSVSDLEIRRGGSSYTVDTLREIHATFPEDDLTFIVGGDMAQSLPAWREPGQVLELATLAVAERAGARRDDILERLSVLPQAAGRVAFFDLPRIDVSSSLIRGRMAAGRPISYLVPDAVAFLIRERGLYRTPPQPHAQHPDLEKRGPDPTTMILEDHSS